jgi:hypothetical protein
MFVPPLEDWEVWLYNPPESSRGGGFLQSSDTSGATGGIWRYCDDWWLGLFFAFFLYFELSFF